MVDVNVMARIDLRGADLPAARLRPHGTLRILADRAAAGD